MYNLEKLKEDRQAEFRESPCYDGTCYTNLKIIGIYYDTDDKVIVDDEGKITLNKIYSHIKDDRMYFVKFGRRFFLDEFFPIYEV